MRPRDGRDGKPGRDGRDGRPGDPGANGRGAYELAVALGFRGDEREWLAALHGKDGRDGIDGKDGTNGTNGKDGRDGIDGKDGTNGKDGRDGIDGRAGNTGKSGVNGNNGWTPMLAVVEDGERRVHRVVDWIGGTGPKPSTFYLGPGGPVATAGEATDLRGATGPIAPFAGGGPINMDSFQKMVNTMVQAALTDYLRYQ